MKILLVGEYSRLHLSLAEGLRKLGHSVTLASDGDSFKNYERDIDLTRKSSGVIDTLSCLISTFQKFRKFKGYDVVQVINPCFTTLNVHINHYLYNMLRKNNKKVFLGAFGDDSYWVRACMNSKTFKYSEFFVNNQSTQLKYNKVLVDTWLNNSREKLNVHIANTCDGIIACLYEYYESYKPSCKGKLTYIPLPINPEEISYTPLSETPIKVSIFIGINEDRSEYKGTDIMLNALLKVKEEKEVECEILEATSVDYDQYMEMMEKSHIVLDQLYSHSPSMNALLALAKGKILIGGGEPEVYDLLDEYQNRPIINVFPSEDNVIQQLKKLIEQKEKLPQLSMRGREFVLKHHNYIGVAKQYLKFWTK